MGESHHEADHVRLVSQEPVNKMAHMMNDCKENGIEDICLENLSVQLIFGRNLKHNSIAYTVLFSAFLLRVIKYESNKIECKSGYSVLSFYCQKISNLTKEIL